MGPINVEITMGHDIGISNSKLLSKVSKGINPKKRKANYLQNVHATVPPALANAPPPNAAAKASPALANAPPPPAHATVLPAGAHTAFTGVIVAGKTNAIAVIATSAPITSRFVFIDLP